MGFIGHYKAIRQQKTRYLSGFLYFLGLCWIIYWWRCRELNPGHCGYEPHALTI